MKNQNRVDKLKEYLEKEPQDPFLNYALAMEYIHDKPEEAEKIFNYLLEYHSEYTATYYHAANLFHELGAVDKARKTYEKGIAICQEKGEHHALRELKTAYQNFLFEEDD